jgi:hypothetical protein
VDGCLSNVESLSQDAVLGDTGYQFPFAVVNVPLWVCESHQPLLNGRRKRASPQDGFDRSIKLGHEMNPTYAHGRRILAPQGVRLFLGDNFSDAGCSASKIRSKPTKVRHHQMHRAREPEPSALIALGLQGILQHIKKAISPRDCQHHGVKLAQELLPLVDCGAVLLGSNGIEDLKQTRHPVRRELHGRGAGVE